MLVLTRREGESLYIGDGIRVTIVSVEGERVKVGVEAPREMHIFREELLSDTCEENRKAAASASALWPLAGERRRSKEQGKGS